MAMEKHNKYEKTIYHKSLWLSLSFNNHQHFANVISSISPLTIGGWEKVLKCLKTNFRYLFNLSVIIEEHRSKN